MLVTKASPQPPENRDWLSPLGEGTRRMQLFKLYFHSLPAIRSYLINPAKWCTVRTN